MPVHGHPVQGCRLAQPVRQQGHQAAGREVRCHIQPALVGNAQAPAQAVVRLRLGRRARLTMNQRAADGGSANCIWPKRLKLY